MPQELRSFQPPIPETAVRGHVERDQSGRRQGRVCMSLAYAQLQTVDNLPRLVKKLSDYPFLVQRKLA